MDLDKLKADLLAMYSHRGDGIPTQHVNPDGPKAVQAITALQARVSELEGALRAMTNAAYPVAHEINPRGYNWAECYLDEALPIARQALGSDK